MSRPLPSESDLFDQHQLDSRIERDHHRERQRNQARFADVLSSTAASYNFGRNGHPVECSCHRCNEHQTPAPFPFESIRKLLAYSWADIHYDYDGLTHRERTCLTREQFDALATWVKGGE